MTSLELTFDQIDTLATTIINTNQRIVYIAGASASGKSHIADGLVASLTQLGKKVLLISSDSYYTNDSQIRYLLYGTFDHPNLIGYQELQHDIEQLLLHDTIDIPTYSFVEKRRTTTTRHTGPFDVIIVEGLYTISQLTHTYHDHHQIITPYTVFVDSPLEEIIMRRIIRDQARVKEPLHTILGVMSHVFPMRNLFGVPQKTADVDCIVSNEFAILDKEGEQSKRKKITKQQLPDTEIDVTHYMTSYIYDDSAQDDGKIIVSEVYLEPDGLLDHVVLQKRSNDPRTDEDMYESISLRLYQPAMITQLHTLLQIAGLVYEGSYTKKVMHYVKDKNASPLIIKEKNGRYYQLLHLLS